MNGQVCRPRFPVPNVCHCSALSLLGLHTKPRAAFRVISSMAMVSCCLQISPCSFESSTALHAAR